MKLIDRYILTNILTPLTYCLVAFLMLFVIFDLFSNLSDFIDAGTPMPYVLKYYVYIIPSAMIFVVPISLLLAVLYGLSQLTRNNELTAMRASGVSLYRLVAPLILLGMLASIAVAVINETLAPKSAYWTQQFIGAEKHKDDDISFYISRNLPFKHPVSRRIWMIGEFDRQTYAMRSISIIQQREDGSDAERITAREGQWKDGRWVFQEVQRQKLDQRGNIMGPPSPLAAQQVMWELEETPTDFINVTKDPEFLSSRELLDFIDAHQHLSSSTIARYMVDLHYRLALPWTCLIVTLLGLPIGAHTGRRGAMGGIAMALLLFFSFYVMMNLGMAYGKKEIVVPWLAVWLPNMLFLGIGIISVYRMR